jgi:demethylphylloquinol methyltransferase
MTQNITSEASEIQAIFDRIATRYDDLNDRLSFGQHRIWKTMAVKWSNPQPGNTALDICCGSGDLAFMLAKKVGRQGKVVGLDFACQQLQIATKKQQANLADFPMEWIEGDALNLPFSDRFFDCATMGYGLRNVTNIPQCLQEVYRVLKPKALVSILDFHRPESFYMDAFQKWYLNNIVIPTAQNFNLTEEYAYLIPSLVKFPTGKEQVKLAYSAGFTKAVHYPLVGGMMGVLVLKK